MASDKQKPSMKPVELKDGASADIVHENVQQLKELFPEAFTEDGVDFGTLRQLLGDLKALDEGEEKYALNWHGKKQAFQIALEQSFGTLLPCPEESVDWDTTQNLFIEGDNLEVLKILRNSYANAAKMIYIDPPYNTGNEFIYPDKFKDNLDTYLKYTGQIDNEGMKFSSNTETSGRMHTNWLNMMYPRLMLAKRLLKPEGILAVHIDENEYSNLDQMLNEIFGKENNLGAIVWDKRNPKGKVSGIAQQHEYIFFFCKNKDALISSDYFYRKKENAPLMLKKAAEFIRKNNGINDASRSAYRKWTNDPNNKLSGGEKAYNQIDDNGDIFRIVSMAAPDRPETRSRRPLIHPKTKKPCPVPEKGWRFPDKTMDELIAKNKISYGIDENTQPGQKYLLKDNMREAVPSLLYFGGSDDALGLPFDNPKPVAVASKLIESVCFDDDLVIDFFAGSATAAHACLKVSAEENRKLRYIMVQLPENTTEKSPAYKAGYETIAEISKERIRLAAKNIKEDNPDYKGDLGFKVFKLASSNIKVWNPDPGDLENSLLEHEQHLVEGRSEQDVLYELLLKRGVKLTVPIETRAIAGKNVHSIGYGKIITCLDDSIGADDVETLAGGIVDWRKELMNTLEVVTLETHVFFKDSAFSDDVAKTNIAAILAQNGIGHVRSL